MKLLNQTFKHHFATWQASWRSWLPSRGNVLFVLLIAGALFAYVRTAGAGPFAAPTAASTSILPYQGRLAEAGGVPLNGSYAMTFKLYNVASSGSALWTETWSGGNTISVTNGLFNVLLGSLTPISPATFANNSSLWLDIKVGADAEMLPRVQLGSAPYALALPPQTVTTNMIAPAAVSQIELSSASAPTSTTSTTWVTVPGLQLNFTSAVTETTVISFNTADTFLHNDATAGGYRLIVDGDPAGFGYVGGTGYTAGDYVPFQLMTARTLAPGPHAISVQWSVDNVAYTLSIGAGGGRLIVERFRR